MGGDESKDENTHNNVNRHLFFFWMCIRIKREPG